MLDILDYLTSPRGMPLVNGAGCATFIAIMLESIFRKRISLGSIPPKIRESENPRTFWSIIFSVWRDCSVGRCDGCVALSLGQPDTKTPRFGNPSGSATRSSV